MFSEFEKRPENRGLIRLYEPYIAREITWPNGSRFNFLCKSNAKVRVNPNCDVFKI